MPINTGKPGTITVEEFDVLSALAGTYGERVLAEKISKICLKRAGILTHEYPSSLLGVAYNTVGSKIKAAVGDSTRVISRDAYTALVGMVDRYGAEVMTRKLGKLASRNENSTDASLLKGIFPKSVA